jgi:multiple sugar transport system permease protein
MKSSNKYRKVFRSFSIHTILIILGFAFSIPFLWLVSTSLKPDRQVFALPPIWIPNPIQWSNYPRALTFIPYFHYMGNSLIIVFFCVTGVLISSSLVAYGFARIPWPGRNVVFTILLSTLMIPYAVRLIPTFLVFSRFGWINTFLPLTIPAFFGDAFSIFLLRQFFMTIPQELSEAARMDGATEIDIFTRIMLPLSRPALAVIALFTFMAAWNDLLGPLVYLNKKELYTLALGMNGYLGRTTQWSMIMAASTVMIMPVIVLFFFAQRTFIQGITLTGIKG